MTATWAVAVDAEDFAAAGWMFGLGVEAAPVGGRWWLRGGRDDEETRRRLLHVPAAARFIVWDGDKLVPLGRIAPTGVMPNADWRPLEECLRPQHAVPMLPGDADVRLTLRMIRGDPNNDAALPEAAALLVDLAVWSRYAETASAVRLAPLSFAVDGSRAIVLGKPLPPLPGTHLSLTDGVLLTLGMAWDPPLSSVGLRAKIGHSRDEYALWTPDGPIEIVPKSAFVAASRSAVRLTVGGGDA